MRFVNISPRSVYTSYSGSLPPGGVSADGGPTRKKLEEVLSEIVKICGNNLGIRLNKKEAELLNKLMDLDEKGGGFTIDMLPEDVRNDPTGEKRSEAKRDNEQKNRINGISNANQEAAEREKIINGEIEERKPVGPATMEGEKVSPSSIKSGFERIMEENARIEAGKPDEKKDVGEILDPIGYHMKGTGNEEETNDDVEEAIGADPVSVSMAKGVDGDATKSADATIPKPSVTERSGNMDKVAADIAEKLSVVGPSEKKAKGRKAKK